VGGALTFSGPRDVGRLRGVLEALAACGGGRVAFAARSMHAWTLPLYELALLTRAWADGRGLDVELTVVAPEPEPLGVLGDAEAQTVRSLLARHRIAYHAAAPEGTVPGGLWVPGLGRIEADVVVALPVLTGPAVDGLPGDRLRFVPVDAFCRVAGTSTAYAVGDMAAHRIKQGGLAAQQADVAAACIAAAAGAAVEPRPYAPDLRALLLTGDDAVALRAPRAKLFGRYLTPYLTSHPALIESTP
jgi:sulfide:quinone oxidoreductase